MLRASVGFGGKLLVLAAYILQAWLKLLGNRPESFDKKLNRVTASILGRITLQFEETKFAIIDWDSLGMFSPLSESFMPLWFLPERRDVVLDIGAHIGKYTVQSARMVGELGKVIAVEPDQKNYEVLLRNIDLNGLRNVTSVHIAAWDTDCDLELFCGDTSGRHSLKRNEHLGSFIVKARSMDRVLVDMNVKEVAWIKIDVEAAEVEVLAGLPETVARCRPRIIVEVTHENFSKVKTYAENANYGIVMISPPDKTTVYLFLQPFP